MMLKFNGAYMLNYATIGYFVVIIASLCSLIVLQWRRKKSAFQTPFDKCLFILHITSAIQSVSDGLFISLAKTEPVVSASIGIIFQVSFYSSLVTYINSVQIRSAPLIAESQNERYFGILGKISKVSFAFYSMGQLVYFYDKLHRIGVTNRVYAYIKEVFTLGGAGIGVLSLMILDILYVTLFLEDISSFNFDEKHETRRKALAITKYSLVCVLSSFMAGLVTTVTFIVLPYTLQAAAHIVLMFFVSLIPLILARLRHKLVELENMISREELQLATKRRGSFSILLTETENLDMGD
ncbi:hypothetical protein MIR68_010720 [Amoeboaphelidium protococcarum]|nr:hypothetical protein MIR68_010720 [Amoeboaphelidium protococcarum]